LKNANAFSQSPTASLPVLTIPAPFIASKQSRRTSSMQIRSTLTKGYVSHNHPAHVFLKLTIPVTATVFTNKYRRALKIKATLPMLREAMASLGVESRSVFETWLEKEKVYLNALRKEPEQETLQMEYYQKLVNLQDQE
jgi:SH3-like domain-containing protein